MLVEIVEFKASVGQTIKESDIQQQIRKVWFSVDRAHRGNEVGLPVRKPPRPRILSEQPDLLKRLDRRRSSTLAEQDRLRVGVETLFKNHGASGGWDLSVHDDGTGGRVRAVFRFHRW